MMRNDMMENCMMGNCRIGNGMMRNLYDWKGYEIITESENAV